MFAFYLFPCYWDINRKDIMTTQKDLNKDMVALLSSVTDSIQELRKEVIKLRDDLDADANFVKELEKGLIHCFDEIKDLKFDKMDKSSQNFRNNNFNDRLINLEENKIKVIDEELKRIDTLEQAFNREF